MWRRGDSLGLAPPLCQGTWENFCGAQGNVDGGKMGQQVPEAWRGTFWKWFLCSKLGQGMFIKEAETGPTMGTSLDSVSGHL